MGAQTLANATGIELAMVERADEQMPFDGLVALYEHAARLTSDDAFGLHLGQKSDHTKYDLLGYLIANSDTYGDALQHLARYVQVWTDAVRFSITVTRSEARLAYLYRDGALLPGERRQESEHMLSTMLHVGRQITGRRWKPMAVCFEHPKPRVISEHRRIFQAPVHFGSARTELVFKAALLELRLPKADPALAALLQRSAQALLGPEGDCDTFAAQVRHVLSIMSGSHDLQVSSVARKLGTSARTLQRRLQEEGASFHALVSEVRSTRAQKYLREDQLAICEIAYLLGFSQPSAFHRAFQRWTGMTPRRFRDSR